MAPRVDGGHRPGDVGRASAVVVGAGSGAAMPMAASVGGSVVVNFAVASDPFFIYTRGAQESFVLIALAWTVVMKAAPLWDGLTVVSLVIASVLSWGIALQGQPILWVFAPIPVLVFAGMIRFGTWQRGRDVADARNHERLDCSWPARTGEPQGSSTIFPQV